MKIQCVFVYSRLDLPGSEQRVYPLYEGDGSLRKPDLEMDILRSSDERGKKGGGEWRFMICGRIICRSHWDWTIGSPAFRGRSEVVKRTGFNGLIG